MKKILFVCSGNTCRSPIAEAIAKEAFSGLETYRISSAGTSALDGLPASPLAVEVASRNSIDLSGHRTRLLSGELVRDADLIVTMGVRHRETVGVIDASALDYTYLLTEFCNDEQGDIPDPIGGGAVEYSGTFEVIRKCVESLIARLEKFDGWKDIAD